MINPSAVKQDPQPLKRRSKAERLGFLPHFFTMGNLLGGFISILLSFNGYFSAATLAVILGALCDTVDGRVARMTSSSSRFGAELDSLADAVSFGVAPAVLFFCWLQSQWLGAAPGRFFLLGGLYSNLVLAVSFLFLACVVLRLARFNTETFQGDFAGLPSPAAALNILGFYWFTEGFLSPHLSTLPQLGQTIFYFVLLALVAAVSFSMVTSWRFIKRLPLARHPVRGAFLGAVLLAILLLEPMIFSLVPTVYWLGNIGVYFYRKWKQSRPSPSIGSL